MHLSEPARSGFSVLWEVMGALPPQTGQRVGWGLPARLLDLTAKGRLDWNVDSSGG